MSSIHYENSQWYGTHTERPFAAVFLYEVCTLYDLLENFDNNFIGVF